MGIGEVLYGRFVRLSALRAVALGIFGAMALVVPGFTDRGLAYSLMGYLVVNGGILLMEACTFDKGPHTPANRVALVTACLLFGLAAGAGLILPHLEKARLLLYGGLMMAEGALYLAVSIFAAGSRVLAVLSMVLLAGAGVEILLAPFGGLVGMHWYVGVLLLVSAGYELAARWLYRQMAY